jgi:hypothetical protein
VQLDGAHLPQPIAVSQSLPGLFILLRGSECNVVKLLQRTGDELISYCNVFFISNLITCVVMVLQQRWCDGDADPE